MIKTLYARAYGNAHLMLALGTLGWGSNTVISKMAVGEVSPMLLIFIRWAMVAILLGLTYGGEIRRAIPAIRGRWLWVFLMGGAGLATFNALFYIAAHSTTALNIGIIQSTIAGFILIGSFLFFKARITVNQVIGLIITLCGVAVVLSHGSWAVLMQFTFNYGDLLMLAACIFYSGYTLGLKKRPNISGMAMMGFFAIAAWLATIPMLAIEASIGNLIWPSITGWLLIVYIAAVPSLLSQVLFIRGVDLIGPAAAGLYTNLVPVYAAILAVVLLGEAFHFFHLAALILVFGGIYLFEIKR